MDEFLNDPYECKAATAITSWDRWIAQAEKLFGRSLDGDQDTDGYSLDTAHDYFEKGETVEEYLKFVQADIARIAALATSEPGYTGDGFTAQADEDAAEQESFDRAVDNIEE